MNAREGKCEFGVALASVFGALSGIGDTGNKADDSLRSQNAQPAIRRFRAG
jgi:hypothetical protein